MTAPSAEELESLREDGLSLSRRRAFEASARAAAAWDRAPGLEDTLDWIDQLRATFGEPPVDRSPWRGHDFRL